MNNERIVKNLYWNDEDLIIEYDDGQIYNYGKAYIKSINYNYNDDELSFQTIETEDLPIKFDDIKIYCYEDNSIKK